MERYHFVTDIEVAAAPDPVWDALADPTAWPAWWRQLRRVAVLAPGRPDGVGRRYRLDFRTALPYTLGFASETTRISPPTAWEARITGDLAGAGRYELISVDGGSRVRHIWIVGTTKPWMNALAPVARPAFAWNHGVLMREFALGLAGRLGVPLRSALLRQVEPGAAGFGELPPPSTGG
jgi:uncharacterized protein YndB with AHSA1/START domain